MQMPTIPENTRMAADEYEALLESARFHYSALRDLDGEKQVGKSFPNKRKKYLECRSAALAAMTAIENAQFEDLLDDAFKILRPLAESILNLKLQLERAEKVKERLLLFAEGLSVFRAIAAFLK